MKTAIAHIIAYLYTNAIKVSIIPWILGFYFVWLQFYIIMIVGCFLFSAVDMFTGRYLAKQKWTFSTQEWGRWRFKRGVYYIMASTFTFFWWTFALIANTEALTIIIAMIPFLVWVGLWLWEADSIMENLEDIDPKNPVVKIIRKVIKFVFRWANKKMDDKMRVVEFVDGIGEWIDYAHRKVFVIKK